MNEENKKSNNLDGEKELSKIKDINKPFKEGKDNKSINKEDKRKFIGGRRMRNKDRGEDKIEEFEQRVIDIARVTRVMAGGKRMRFRACVAIGNKKGRVAVGLSKGADVTIAVTKAVNKAKKNFIEVAIVNDTIPHQVYQKLGASKILFKPARRGRGIIAGGAVRVILELCGIKNITSKILGTDNKVNNVRCTLEALKSLKKKVEKVEDINKNIS